MPTISIDNQEMDEDEESSEGSQEESSCDESEPRETGFRKGLRNAAWHTAGNANETLQERLQETQTICCRKRFWKRSPKLAGIAEQIAQQALQEILQET